MSYDTKPLVPKHPDGQLRVLAIGRLSKPKATEDATNETIESSLAVVEQHLSSIYQGPLLLTPLAEQESGLIADRETILQAEELIDSGEIDLVIAEDLSRIYRSARHQYVFVEDCVDAGVRVICVADRLDTADEDWERALGTASFIHSAPISDARRRQGRKNTFAFHRGGNVQKFKYGYTKLTHDQAQSGSHGRVGLRIAKDTEATAVIKRMRKILMTRVCGQYTYVPVVDWLNENGVPVGPYVNSGEWNRRLVKDLLTDPILIGVRRFRRTLFTRVRKTGKFRRELNPDGPETEHYPELAHLTDDEFATMQEVIKEIEHRHRNCFGAEHPLYRKPRRDAIFPRQHATCSICGGFMYAYDTDQMKCANAHARGPRRCWNHVQVDMQQAQRKVVDWLVGTLQEVSGIRSQLVNFAGEELRRLDSRRSNGRSSRRRTIAQLEREAARVAKAIRRVDEVEALAVQVKEIDEQLARLRRKEQRAEIGKESLPVEISPDEIDVRLDGILFHLAATSHKFADLVREIIPAFEIIPVQAIDSGLVRPRARITLSVDGLGQRTDPDLSVPDVQVELDLFDPPKHIRHLDACREIKREYPSWSYVRIAREFNEGLSVEGDTEATISYMTVKRAFALHRCKRRSDNVARGGAGGRQRGNVTLLH